MLVLALLLTSSATTSSCLSFSEIGAGREYRPDSFASEYRALRADDECGHYWFEFENTAVKLVDSGLELRGGTQVALEFDVDPTVEVLVETARHRGGRWEHSPRGHPGPWPWFTRLSDYRRLCTGPCKVQLGEGRHYFALAHPGGVLAEVPQPLDLRAATKVKAELTSYSAIRSVAVWGVVGGLLSTLGSGAAVAVATINDASPETQAGAEVALVSSLAVVAVSAVALFVFRDEVQFEAEPLP